ncbi:MAG: hypothetical protein H0V05_16815 [Euzebyaceae bacterium]|jgi:hypothetical protein|nr:hypothetical protein [Euzebyaceae bacterium]
MVSRYAAGRVMIGVGIFGVVAGLVGTIVGVQLVDQLDSALNRSLTLTSDSLETVESSLVLAEETVDLVNDGLTDAERTARDLETTMQEGERLLTSTAELTGTQVADSIEAMERSMPALIQVATAVDASLSALSELPFGPGYNPDQPFDESVRDLQTSISGLPDELREQALLIEGAGANLGEAGRGATAVADDLAAIDAGLAEALVLLGDYTAAATDARQLLATTADDLERQANISKIMIAALGLTIALGQVVPLFVGWELLQGRRGEVKRAERDDVPAR